jgi:hypothetical protein
MATNRFGDTVSQPPTPTDAPLTNRFGDTVGQPVLPKEKVAEDEGVLQEFAEGVGSGLIGIGQGIGELVASGIDLVADTDYAESVTNAGEATRDYLGLDPTGFVGKGAEIITQFVIPGVGVAGAVSKAGKAARLARGATGPMTRSQRFGQAAKELAAAGAVDAAVANDGTTTIGDFFDGGPTATNQEIGLSGREEALRRLGNKFKVGTEAALLGGVAQGVLSGLGVGAQKAAQTQTGQAVGRAVGESQPVQAGKGLVNRTREYLKNAERRRVFGVNPGEADMGRGEQFIADALGSLRYRSYLPEEMATERLLIQGKVQPYIKRAEVTLNKLEKNIDTAIGKMGKEVDSEVERRMIFDNIEEYLTNPDAEMKKQFLAKLPANIRGDVQNMRQQVTNLSEGVLNSNFLKENNFVDKSSGRAVKDVINENINSYLRRRYRVFEDKAYTPTSEQLNIATKEFQKDKISVQSELTKMARGDAEGLFTDAELNRIGAKRLGAGDQQRIVIDGKVTDEAARLARDSFLGRNRLRNRSNAKLSGGRVAENRLDTGMFMERKYLPKYQRELLGEIDDPREAFIGTVADLAQFKAVDEYFGNLKSMAQANNGFGKFFIDPNTMTPLQQKQLLDSGQYVQLGSARGRSTLRGEATDELDEAVDRSGWGSLHGYIVPERIYKDLTQTVLAEDGFGSTAIRGVWDTFLRGKGISQYSKTVLSPVTQVRNFTTASLFALSQGNIGRGMKGSLGDSMKLTFKQMFDGVPDDVVLDELAELQRRGIIGTQTELREIQDMINKGIGYSTRGPKGLSEALGGETGRRLADTKLARTVGKGTKMFEDAYQNSDDFWKIYNYQFETNKLRNALREMAPADQYKYLTKGQDLNPQMRREIIGDPAKMDELLKDRAAQIVRDTVPNYNKAPELIKAARKLPVGNFITFPYEIFRTGGNTIRQAIEEMNPANAEGIRNIGRRRMAGAIGTFGVMPAAVANLGYALSGVSRDEMKAYQRSFSAPWEKNAVLVPIGRDEDGNLQYVNFSTTNPYDSIISMFNAAINEADEGYRQGKSAGEITLRAGFETLKDFFEPFLSQSIVTEAFLDVTARGGKTSTGAQVYNPQDSTGDILGKSFAHVLEGIMPNVVPAEVKNLNPANMQFEPSRFARGVVGSVAPGVINPKDKLGRERKLSEEMFRVFTGVTPMQFDPEFALRINAGRLQRAQTDAKRIFNSVLDDGNLTADQMVRAYQQANDRKRVVDEQYFQVIEDLQTLGMSKGQIRKLLKQNKIGGADQIMRGRFEPFKLTDDARRKMRTAGNSEIYKQTRGPLRDIYKELRGTKLTRDEEPAPQPAPSTNRFGDPIRLNMQVPQPGPLPQPTPNRFGDPTRRNAQVDPRLLPDPRTRELLNP